MNISGYAKSPSNDVQGRHPFVIPKYMELYPFENEDFDYPGWHAWMQNTAPSFAFLLIGCYLILIVTGQQWMKTREPYRWRGLLVFWNVALAGFSMMAFLRLLPEIVHLLKRQGGFHDSICSREEMNIATAFWILAVSLSKTIELGDTAFIVLRKQRLLGLHVIHHSTVILYTFYTYADHDPAHRWFATINSFVHIFLYSYFALKAVGIKLPKTWAVAITLMEVLQMFVGTGLNLYAFFAPRMGLRCDTKSFNVGLALGVYAIFVVLFTNFFYQSFVQRKTKKTE